MSTTIGIRREDKHAFEARAPLTPDAVKQLVADGISVVVQPSPIRAYPDGDYEAAGATVDEDLSGCDVVFAVKEIPMPLLREGGAYVFFSHTIKGQPHNMPLLARLMELGCTLIDYEKITDEAGKRLVFFGRHAGLAGMIDTFSVLGSRLAHLGHETAFSKIDLAHTYPDLTAAEAAVREAGAQLGEIPEELAPMVFGFAGYGNVSRGAQQIFDLMPHETVTPEQLAARLEATGTPRDRLLKVVFEEKHLAEPVADGAPFVLQEYYDHPERFRGRFEPIARQLSVLVNAIFWTEDYPRLVSLPTLKSWGEDRRLLLVGDISCDIDGAVACTVKATTPGEPAYVYEPATGAVRDGVEGPGLAMMTTDCLPCELPRESTESFTAALLPFVAATAKADLAGSFEAATLPGPMRRAVILWRGELTPDFAYLKDALTEA